MYSYIAPEPVIKKLKELKASNGAESTTNTLTSLCEDPFKRAKSTNGVLNCEHYVNCGKYALLIEIDKSKKLVHILEVLRKSRLHKQLTGWN